MSTRSQPYNTLSESLTTEPFIALVRLLVFLSFVILLKTEKRSEPGVDLAGPILVAKATSIQ